MRFGWGRRDVSMLLGRCEGMDYEDESDIRCGWETRAAED